MWRGLALVICLLIALPLAAQDSDQATGGGLLERALENSLSGAGRTVTVTGFQGALSAQASLETLTIADDQGVWITLSGVVLDWSRAALLRGRLEVAELAADEISLARLPDGGAKGVERAEARPFALPDLPVSIRIDRIATQRLVLAPPVLGQAAVLRVEGAVNLAGGAGRARLNARRSDAIGKFSLDADFSNETRELSLDLDLAEAAGGLLSSRLGLPGAPPLALRLEGAGPLSDFAADLSLSTDQTPRVTGRFTLAAPPDDPAARTFALVAQGDLAPLLAPRFRPFFGSAARIDVTGTRGADGALSVQRLDLVTRALRLGGTMALGPDGGPQRVTLDGQVAGPVTLPLAGPETRLDRAVLQARFDAAKGEGWTFGVETTGLSRDGLTLGALRLDGQGTIRPGAVRADLRLEAGALNHSDPALARALGQSATGTARLAWAEGTPLRLDHLAVQAGDASLSGAGEIGPLADGLVLDGRARMGIEDLARLAPLAGRGLAGAADLRLSGRYAVLGGAFDLALSGQTSDLVTGTPRLDPLLAGPGRVQLSAERGPQGTLLRALDIRTAGIGLSLAGDLSTGGGGLRLTARAADLAPVDPGLAGPASVQARIGWQAGGQLRLDQVEAEIAGARITAEGTLAPEDPALPVSGWLELDAPDLAVFSGLAGRSLSGAVTARGQAEGALRGPGDADLQLTARGRDLRLGLGQADALWRGESRLRLEAGRDAGAPVLRALDLTADGLRVEAGPGATPRAVALRVRLADLSLLVPELPGALRLDGSVVPDGDRLRLDLDAQGPGGIAAQLRGRVANDGARADLSLTGQAPLAIANAAIAPRSLDGVARFDLALNGAPGLSALSGRIVTEGTRLALPALSATIPDLSGRVDLAAGQARLALSGGLGGGRVSVDGRVGLAAPFPADLAVTLDRAGLRDPALYDTSLDGRVTLVGPLSGGARIAGRVGLGRTEVTVPSGTAGGGGGPIPEIAHRNAPAAVQATRARAGLIARDAKGGAARPWPLDLVIEAPGQLFVRGRGLDAELGGRIHLRGTSADVVPEGRFDLIRGRLDILTKRFVLSEGRIELQGALDPYLRFVATSRTPDATVSVVLEGLASAPGISFVSDPELPEEEVLAQLLFGQGIDNISALQAAELAAAVANLAGGGGGGLLSRLRQGAGLDDLDVSQGANGETQLRLGKYLSDNVYSEVTVDQGGRSTIELNLDVTPSVTARGSLGAEGETGIGLFYERDY